MNHEATRRRKKNVGGERSVTDRHKMSGTVTEEMLTTETGMIDTGITTGIKMSVTTGITLPVTTNEGRVKAIMKTGPDRVTGTKNASTKNGTLERRTTNGSRKRAPQLLNQTKAKHLPDNQ